MSLTEPISTEATTPLWVAFRRATCAHTEIGATITAPQMLPGIYKSADDAGVRASHPFARYVAWRETDCDLEIGVLLDEPFDPPEGIEVAEWATQYCAVARFHGPYSQLAPIYENLRSYLEANGLDRSGPPWEVYPGPGTEPGVGPVHIFQPVCPQRK